MIALVRGRYAGLNDIHLTEKFTRVEAIAVSRATVQPYLRGAGLCSSRRRRPRRHRGRRPRRPQPGLLLQLNGSPFAWFGDRGRACTLLAAIRDATGPVLAACFRAEEEAAGSLGLLREVARTAGVPAAVYADQHGIFVRNDPHWTVAGRLAEAQEQTPRSPMRVLAQAERPDRSNVNAEIGNREQVDR